MAREETTFQAYGAVGNNIAVDSTVISISPLRAGRYRIWGDVRHTLVNGLKFFATDMSAAITIAQSADRTARFGPIVMDLNTNANTILLQLSVATGPADTASANLYAQKI